MGKENPLNSNTYENRGANLVRSHIAEIRGYVPGEQPTDPSVLKLNTNENPYPPSPAVAEAIARACQDLSLYPDPSASELRACAADLYGVDPDGVLVGNGSDEILSIILRATVGPDDSVAYPVPTYSYYDSLAALCGVGVQRVPFGDDYELPSGLAEVSARLIIVCNPNAPSGTVVPIADIEALAQSRTDTVVLVDEAYVDFADDSALRLVGRLPNVIVSRTLSKSYSLAGLRVGFAFTSAELAFELHKIRDSYNASRLLQAGALAALRDQESLRRHVGRVRATRDRLTAALRELDFQVSASHTNFVLARRPGESLAPVYDALRSRRILVRYFEQMPDAFRVTVGTDEQIDRFLEALREIWLNR